MTDTITVPRALLERVIEAWGNPGEFVPIMNDAVDALRSALEQPQQEQDPRACGGRNCGSTDPRYHSAECLTDQQPPWSVGIEPAFVIKRDADGLSAHPLEQPQQESDLYAVFRYAREADTPLLRHCLDLIEGEWPADDPAAGPLMVKLRQRLGVQP